VLAPVLLGLLIFVLLLVDLRVFARGREATFRESVAWSVGWLALSVAVTAVVWALQDGTGSANYLTVYFIERSLSLDNLFVFLLLFAYFAVPINDRARLLFWGIVLALALRAVAIVAGVALLEHFSWAIYVLGALLLLLSYRMLRGLVGEVDPEANLLVRLVRRVYPVTSGPRAGRWFVHEGGRRHATPIFLCLVAFVFADIAFAVDSIPAAFGITRDPLTVWMGNAFALLGMRALFALVEGLARRFRYLDQTIAIVLAFVAAKLLLADLVHLGPIASLAGVALLLAGGIAISLAADSRAMVTRTARPEG